MATQNAQARTVTAAPASKGLVNVSSLVLLAILLAAGFILNMTVGNALAVTGIKPQFIIAAYALAIALTQASFAQAAIFGILSAAVIQITTSIPGLNFVTELAGALTMVALVKSNIGGDKINPFIAGLLTTLVSGLSSQPWASSWVPRCLRHLPRCPSCSAPPSLTPSWSRPSSSRCARYSASSLI